MFFLDRRKDNKEEINQYSNVGSEVNVVKGYVSLQIVVLLKLKSNRMIIMIILLWSLIEIVDVLVCVSIDQK